MAHISPKDKNLVAELSINNTRYIHLLRISGFPGGASGKEPTCQCRRWKRCWFNLSREDPLGKGNGNPLPYSCLENSIDRRAWRATVHRVTRARHGLRPLSTHAVVFFQNVLQYLDTYSSQVVFFFLIEVQLL